MECCPPSATPSCPPGITPSCPPRVTLSCPPSITPSCPPESLPLVPTASLPPYGRGGPQADLRPRGLCEHVYPSPCGFSKSRSHMLETCVSGKWVIIKALGSPSARVFGRTVSGVLACGSPGVLSEGPVPSPGSDGARPPCDSGWCPRCLSDYTLPVSFRSLRVGPLDLGH